MYDLPKKAVVTAIEYNQRWECNFIRFASILDVRKGLPVLPTQTLGEGMFPADLEVGTVLVRQANVYYRRPMFGPKNLEKLLPQPTA